MDENGGNPINAGLKEENKETSAEWTPTVGMLVSQVAKTLHWKFNKVSEAVGMPLCYRKILFTLMHSDGINQIEIGKLINLKPPTVSVTLQKMERDGFISRETDPRDQRQVIVSLTEEGRALDMRVHTAIESVDKKMVEGFSDEELEVLRAYCKRMLANLEDSCDDEKSPFTRN